VADRASKSLAVLVPPPPLAPDQVQSIIERLTPCEADLLLWLPADRELITTAGPMMRVLIRLMWLRNLRLVEVQGPVGEGETARLTEPGSAVAVALRQVERQRIAFAAREGVQ
jgi:hypothetical protein